MCAGLLVPVSGSIPAWRANRKMICAGVLRWRVAIARREAIALRRAVQDEAVEVLELEVLERAGERLRDLLCDRRGGVIRQPVILAIQVGELALYEQLVAPDPGGQRSRDPAASARLVVVFALIRGVDPAEPAGQRAERERLGGLFFPRGAV